MSEDGSMSQAAKTLTATESAYLEAARAAAPRLPGQNAAWVSRLRSDALDRFGQTGFPSARDEEWRYTNVAPITRQSFAPVLSDRRDAPPIGDLKPFLFEGLATHRAVFIDGRLNAALSDLDGLPDGIRITGLARTLEGEGSEIEAFVDRDVAVREHGFNALNSALLADGAVVRVAEGVVASRPIHLLFLTTAQSNSSLIAPHNVIVAGAGSQATVVEHYASLSEAVYLTNAITRVCAGENSGIDYYRLQQESTQAYHIGGVYIRQDQDSRVTSHTVDFGGLLVRNEVKSVFASTGGSCELDGLYFADGLRHVDNHTFIDHALPRCISRQFYKGVVDGRARAVFSGRVLVRPDAQHTDAAQLNKNLLLSAQAEADTKPQLEIYADDVKCSHGAAVGQLDAGALFYLASRGLDEAAARSLLTYAFVNDVLRRFKLSVLARELKKMLVPRLFAGWTGEEELELI